jgi:hypothetical protein
MARPANTLAFPARYPHLLKQWDYTLNSINPKTVHTIHSETRYFWKCNNGYPHSYEASVGSLVDGRGCNICASKVLLKGFNDFATKSPEQALWWDYDKNTLNPDEVFSKNNNPFWFLCPSYKHSFYKNLLEVTSGEGCPYCSGSTYCG